ncbi:hypothetical protein SH611_17875 [Geminicoccaceae bacterium 1502E]|nr:hypothetical protein [Geminicoccaceae bacterium 1502E]
MTAPGPGRPYRRHGGRFGSRLFLPVIVLAGVAAAVIMLVWL